MHLGPPKRLEDKASVPRKRETIDRNEEKKFAVHASTFMFAAVDDSSLKFD